GVEDGGGVGARGVARLGQRDRAAAVTPESTTDDSLTATAHAASAGSVDVTMLRRSWPALIEHLGNARKMILKAFLESATVSSYDGTTLELAFPPNQRVGPQKVEERQEDLRDAMADVFGIRPQISCVVREHRDPSGGPASIEIVDE